MVIEALNEIKPESKVLVLLEDEKQVKDYLGRKGQIPGKKKLIALSPFAMYELDRHEVSYKIIEDCYDQKELYALGMDNYSKVEELCNLIDSHIYRKFPKLKELGIKPAFFSIFHLKMLYDSATIRLFQLSKFIDSEKPDIVVIYQSKHFPLNPEMGVQSLFPNNHESIYSQLLELQGWRVKVAILPEASSQESSKIETPNVNRTQRLKDRVLKRVQNSPVLYEFAVTFKKVGWRAVLSRLRDVTAASADNPVLLYGGGYNWDYCRKDLKNMGIGPVIRVIGDQHCWLDSVSMDEEKRLSAAWSELKKDDEFREFFLWGKIDFFPLMEERLRFIVERIAPACLRSYEEAESIIKDKKIKALIASTFASCFGHSFAQAAHNANIPAIIWEHGPFGLYDSRIKEYTDFFGSDFHFSWSEGLFDVYSKRAQRHGAKICPVGSAKLDALYKKHTNKREIKKRNRKVLYVTTHYFQNLNYIAVDPFFSDNLLWIVQKNIMDVLAKSEQDEVIIKLFPNEMYREPPLRKYALDMGYTNIKFFKQELRFIDLLDKADAVIMDDPTTVLVESLTTKKPIFAYTGHLYIDERNLKKLKKRAYCYSDLSTFTEALDKFLSGKDIGRIDYNNTEFLEYYGMYKLDGKAGERAASEVKSIIETWKKDRQRKA